MSPDSTIPLVGASGAIAAVLGGYALLYPYARVLTLFFLFFIFILEIPALVLLGLWILLQFLPAVGQLATPELGGGRRRRILRAHRRVPVRTGGRQAVRQAAQQPATRAAARSIRSTRLAMQTVVQVLMLGFIVLFAGLTIEVISTSGFDILSGGQLVHPGPDRDPRDRRPVQPAAG